MRQLTLLLFDSKMDLLKFETDQFSFLTIAVILFQRSHCLLIPIMCNEPSRRFWKKPDKGKLY